MDLRYISLVINMIARGTVGKGEYAQRSNNIVSKPLEMIDMSLCMFIFLMEEKINAQLTY